MDIVDQIIEMTSRLEQHTETRQELYTVLLLAMLEIRKLNHELAVLRDKNNDNYTNIED